MHKKKNLLEKIVKKDYNNELEKVLETKQFDEHVKSTLLSILYKIEAAYKDLETVKKDVQTKEEYVANIIEIIKNNCDSIKIIRMNDEENKIPNNKTYIVDLENILYLYRDNYKRKTVLVTDFGEHMINDTLENIKSKLSDDFKYSHKSYILNTKRVSVLDWKNNDVIFDNGVKANILSKSRRKELDSICLKSD